MKKIALFAFAAFAMFTAKAEDIYQIVPVKTHAGSTIAAENRMDVILTRDTYTNNTGVQFDIVVPAGMTISKFAAVSTGLVPSHKEEILDDDDEPTGNYNTVYELTHTLASMGGNTYRCMVVDAAATGAKLKEGQSGVVGRLTFKTSSSMAPGVYPIILKNTELTDGATGSAIRFGSVLSYVVVGDDVKDGALVAEGTIPSKVNEALATETAISNLDLSAATAINGEFAYTVGRAVTVPAVTADVKVVAGLNGGTYGSLCSPVALPGVKCYKFTGASGDVATFTEVDDVPANEVVIIDAAVDATVTGATLASVANGTADAGRLYVAPDGSVLRRAKNAVSVPALRGTWDIAGGSNLRIALDTPTGIKMIGTAEEVLGNTYDLQGRQVENAQNGVYVVNGKKQFVK